jgi:hypothetical protein
VVGLDDDGGDIVEQGVLTERLEDRRERPADAVSRAGRVDAGISWPVPRESIASA